MAQGLHNQGTRPRRWQLASAHQLVLFATLAALAVPCFADKIRLRASGQVHEGKILDRTDSLWVRMQKDGGGTIGFRRRDVEIVEWDGATNAASLLEGAKELLDNAEKAMKQGRFAEAFQLGEEAKNRLARINRHANQFCDQAFAEAQKGLHRWGRLRAEVAEGILIEQQLGKGKSALAKARTRALQAREQIEQGKFGLAHDHLVQAEGFLREAELCFTRVGSKHASASGLRKQAHDEQVQTAKLIAQLNTHGPAFRQGYELLERPLAGMDSEGLTRHADEVSAASKALPPAASLGPSLAKAREALQKRLAARIGEIAQARESGEKAGHALANARKAVDESADAVEAIPTDVPVAQLPEAEQKCQRAKNLLIDASRRVEAISDSSLSSAQRQDRSLMRERIGRLARQVETKEAALDRRAEATKRLDDIAEARRAAATLLGEARAKRSLAEADHAVKAYADAASQLGRLDATASIHLKRRADALHSALTAGMEQATELQTELRLAEGWFGDPMTKTLVPPTAPNLLKALGAALDQHNLPQAEAVYRRLMQKQSDHPLVRDASDMLARLLLELAAARQAKREFKEAIALCDGLLARYPASKAARKAAAMRASCRRARFTQRVWPYAQWAVLALTVLVAAAVGATLYLRSPDVVESRSLARVAKLDATRSQNLRRAQKGYQRIIRRLRALSKRRPLREPGKQALGRACLGDAMILLSQGNKLEAQRRYEQAAAHIEVSQSGFVPLLAEVHLRNQELTDDAVGTYVSYLRLPAAEAKQAAAEQMASLLEGHSRIDEQTERQALPKKMQLNLKLATVPAAPPCLVVFRGAGVGRQYGLDGETRIGTGSEADVVIRDPAAASTHAAIRREDDGYAIRDLGTPSGTLVAGKKIEGSRRLADEDEIQLGDTRLVFYSKPRPLGRPLEFPHFHLGVGYFLRGDHTTARAELERAIELRSDRADSHWYLGRVHHATGAYAPAFQEFEVAVAADPAHHGAHHSWGQALLQYAEECAQPQFSEGWSAKVSEAIHHLTQAAHLGNRRGDYFFDLAKAQARARQVQDALESVGRAIRLDAGKADYHILHAHLALSAGDTAAAKAAAQRVLAIDPNHAAGNHIYGDLCFEEGDYQEAAQRLELVKSIEARQDSKPFSGTPRFAYRLGRALFETGRYPAASRALAPVAEQSAEAMFYAGRCHSRTDHFDGAVKIFRWALRHFGEDAATRFYLASSLGNLGRYDDALGEAAPLERNEEWASRACCLGGRLLARMGRLDEATDKLERGRRGTPADTQVWFELGRVACVRGDFGKASAALDSALRLAPNDPQSHLWAGRALFSQRKHEEARPHFERVLAATAQDGEEARALAADAHYHLGRIARSRSDQAAALSHFEEARRHGHPADQLAFELAATYADCGKHAEALAEFSSLAMKAEKDPVVEFDLAAVSCRMARARLAEGRYEEGIPLLEQGAERFAAMGATHEAAEATGALAEASFRLGVQCLQSGDGRLPDGAEALERACALCPDDARSKYYLGAIYFLSGSYEKAVGTFRGILDAGRREPKAMRALALSLEQAGRLEEAEGLWHDVVQHTSNHPVSKIKSKLGLAGFYARKTDWRSTAHTLHEVLDDDGAEQHPAHEELCKLAVSYFSLAGDAAAAEEVIQEHLRGASPAAAEAYLGAVLAQQDRLDDALPHLRRAAKAKDASEATLDLYEAVCRCCAASQVLKGDLEGAARTLTEATTRRKKPEAGTTALLDAVEAAIALSGAGSQPSEKALAAYEKAHKAHPGNVKILRNLAAMCLKLAITTEARGSHSAADRYWERSARLWAAITNSDAFWDSYVEAFNRGRHRRDRLDKKHIAAARHRVVETVADVHVGFAKAYATAGGALPHVRRHVKRAMSLCQRADYHKRSADYLMDGLQLSLKDRVDELAEFAEVILEEVNPGDEKTRELAFGARATAAINALWDEDVGKFQTHLGRAAKLFKGEGDFADMGRKTARVDRSFISRVVHTAKRTVFGMIPGLSSQRDRQKDLLFKIVLNLGSFAANLTLYERSQLEAQLPMVITKLLVELVK